MVEGGRRGEGCGVVMEEMGREKRRNKRMGKEREGDERGGWSE